MIRSLYGRLSNKPQAGYYVSSSNSNILREKADQLYYSWEYANHKLTVNFTDGLKLVDPDKPQATIDEFFKKIIVSSSLVRSILIIKIFQLNLWSFTRR